MLMRAALYRMRTCMLILLLPLGYGVMLAWQETRFRQGLQAPAPASSPAVTATPPAQLNTQAVATVLGLSAQDRVVNSAEPLTLLATVIDSTSESRALLAGPTGERFYRAGERLSASSVLRRIEPGHVVLWRQGREELLMLRPAGERFLHAVDTPPKEATRLHFKPVADQPKSE
ncbi:hypothetical protein ICY20_10460 [Pseudomonas sp. P115]|uniref:type II secretion system protein N n=1 Tax=Pseudomonas pisciculturae TaxID=2730413 RepID=UPI00135A5C61|nr:type II secretion system protein N [Pseudomonas pisciculturae]MBF6028163.1 hypothetical protein [Pseudomonas pisciculturae]